MAGTAQPQAVKFAQSYNGLDPSTIFQVDPATKTLSPFNSGQAYTDAGFQFGQETAGNPADYAGFNVGSPIVPKATQLDAVKTDLNSYQNSLFGSEQDANKRQSSQLDQQIADATQQSADEAKQFDTLRQSLNSQDNVSLADEFAKLSNDQGVPQINNDLATTRDAERNLQPDLRTVSGNAGAIPESVFQANLAQKQQPLMLKEQTLTDRLSAAQNYIQQALSLKQSDQTASANKLNQAITLVGDSINASQNRISNLNTLRSNVQDKISQGQNTATATINTLVQTGALSKLAPNDLHSLELEAGMPAGTLDSIAKSIQPQAKVLSTETDNYGNISVISQNPDGSVTAHVVPGAKGKTSTTATGGPAGIAFSAADKQGLVAAGFTAADITNIQSDINKYGIDAVTKGMAPNQTTALNKVLGGTSTNQFINTAFLNTQYGSGLDAAAKKAGYSAGGIFGIGAHGDTTGFINHLMDLVSQYRQAGYTDDAIIKLLP